MAVYACSDLHGHWDLWEQIKEFLKPDDTLYYLGDATDRGPDGWDILKDMFDDKRVKYIAGNHDIMLAHRIGRPYDYYIATIHHQNGGGPTWENAKIDPDANLYKWKIRNLPRHAIYTNKDGLKIFMSHSGSTDIEDEEALIWDRNEYITNKNYTDYDVIIHGHTPIPYLIHSLEGVHNFYFQDSETEQFNIPKWDSGAFWYHGFRCDIDCCTIETGQTVLLDLDTFDEHIFYISN